MHLDIFPFQTYISSKTYVFKDQTFYIYIFFFYRKKKIKIKNEMNEWISCVTETSTKPLFYKLQWLCNGATPQCKDKGPFWFLVFLVFDVKKPPVCLQRSKNGNSDAYFFYFKTLFSFLKNNNKFSSIKKPLFSSLCTNGESVKSLDFLFVLKHENYYYSFFIFIYDNTKFEINIKPIADCSHTTWKQVSAL